jgi:hypothetical protein
MQTKNTRTARVDGGSIVVGLDGLETVLGP